MTHEIYKRCAEERETCKNFIAILILKVIRRHQTIMQVVPEYKELSVSQVWKHVKEVPELYKYFPDYTAGQLPNREFMYAVISTTYPKALRSLIEDSRKKRIETHEDDKDELIDIDGEFKNEIMGILTQKGNKENFYAL